MSHESVVLGYDGIASLFKGPGLGNDVKDEMLERLVREIVGVESA